MGERRSSTYTPAIRALVEKHHTTVLGLSFIADGAAIVFMAIFTALLFMRDDGLWMLGVPLAALVVLLLLKPSLRQQIEMSKVPRSTFKPRRRYE